MPTPKPGTKEYHAYKSREWYARLTPEEHLIRNRTRSQKRRDKKTKWVQKFGSKCHDCNLTFVDCVFDFHHVDINGRGKQDPQKLFMLSDKRIKEELDKCIMLCANCHRMRHLEDNYQFHSKRSKYA